MFCIDDGEAGDEEDAMLSSGTDATNVAEGRWRRLTTHSPLLQPKPDPANGC